MKLHRWIVSGLLGVVVSGCASTPPAPSVPGPATPEQVRSIRMSLTAQSPNVQVGVVEAVLESELLAAIEDVELSAFKLGDTVCFIDSATNPLVCGRVVRITDTQVHVRYEMPPADRRAPMKGDVAVAFRE